MYLNVNLSENKFLKLNNETFVFTKDFTNYVFKFDINSNNLATIA